MKIYQVDAFADKPFAGNPAGVCLTAAPLRDELMQNIAMEMNLSETAFLVRQGQGFALRWFTPESEVTLCGHATLASAHVLYEAGLLHCGKRAEFYTASGTLYAEHCDGLITLDFPACAGAEVSPPDGLCEALGVDILFCGTNGLDLLVEVASEDVVRAIAPDYNRLKKLDVRAVMVTAKANPGSQYDFVSRFFAPAVGVNEDPVTGSAHCCLVPYWREKLGKDDFVAFQASKRGGELVLQYKDGRVRIIGKAVTVFVIETKGI